MWRLRFLLMVASFNLYSCCMQKIFNRTSNIMYKHKDRLQFQNSIGKNWCKCCQQTESIPNNTLYNWTFSDIFNGAYSTLLLNSPISNPELVLPIFKKADFKILVDGGANRLYDIFESRRLDSSTIDEYLPNILCGDFDSIRMNVLEFYRESGVTIIETPDQNKNDFFKAIEILQKNSKSTTIIVYCETRDRIDHMMGNINVLFQTASNSLLKNFNIFIMGDKSFTWLLRPGQHIIKIPEKLWTEKSYCSLLPIGHPSFHVTTDGLKYNLYDSPVQFGGMVSSSNTYDVKKVEPEVNITTDNFLIWSMSLR